MRAFNESIPKLNPTCWHPITSHTLQSHPKQS
uniref:Uncharacterized protein n=1 Tax=Anguilla anguilla TaxID=7936 RepID=A0A0E9SN79_ANGAN